MHFPTLLGESSAAKPKEAEAEAQGLDFGVLLSKLEAAETRIRGLVVAAIPEVKVQLPRLEASSFEAATSRSAGVGTSFTAIPSAPDGPDMEMGTVGEGLLRVEDEAAAKDRFATAAGTASHVAEHLRAPLLAAAISLTLVVSAALAGVGPLPAALAAAVASAFGSAFAWHGRATSIRFVVAEHLEAVIAQVVEVLRSGKESILCLSKQLTVAVDEMAEEQRPALDKIQELESTLKVDVPDPSDLKKSLQGCEGKVLAMMVQAEDEIPSKVRELASTASFIGKVAMDGEFFVRVVTGLPSLAMVILNLSFAIVQSGLDVDHHNAQDISTVAQPFTHQASNMTLGADIPGQDVDWAEYLHPWVAQMVLMVVQVVAAMLLSHSSRVCSWVNAMIATVEEKANASLNEKIAAVVDQACGQAFEEVTQQCDHFFPQFKDVMCKLEEAMDLVAKAEALAGDAGKLKSMMKW